MIALQSIDVAKVPYALANKIECGKILPRQVVIGEDRFEMDFYEVLRIEERKGQ